MPAGQGDLQKRVKEATRKIAGGPDCAPLQGRLRTFLALLNSKGVPCLLTGGHALAHHGYVRATADMDIWVGRQRGSAEKLMQAFEEFGIRRPRLCPELLLEVDLIQIGGRPFKVEQQDRVIRVGRPPFQIEIMLWASGVVFEECYRRRVVTTIDNVEVNVISLEDLIANKKAANRPVDLDDIEHLRGIAGT